MKQFPRFIPNVFLPKWRGNIRQTRTLNPTTVERSLSGQVARYIPLLELQDKRQLLEVEVAGNCHLLSYQSMIVGIDFIKRWVLLDGLTPINPYCPIISGDQLVVTHKRQGQILSFSGELVEILSDSEHLIYAVELPEEIAYQQRRFYPRLVLSGDLKNTCPLSVKLKSPLKTPWHCVIKNISAGGMRVSVAGKITNQLAVGKILPIADIILNELKISCPLTIKSFRQERRPYEHTEISLAFSEINARDRVRLQNFIGFYLQPHSVPASLAS